jgi:Bacterial cadherin-like domain
VTTPRLLSGGATVKAHAKDDGGASLGGTSKCAQRVFTITVRAVNDAQVAREDSYKVSEDQTLTVRASGVSKTIQTSTTIG